jgi:hypothetical protein
MRSLGNEHWQIDLFFCAQGWPPEVKDSREYTLRAWIRKGWIRETRTRQSQPKEPLPQPSPYFNILPLWPLKKLITFSAILFVSLYPFPVSPDQFALLC